MINQVEQLRRLWCIDNGETYLLHCRCTVLPMRGQGHEFLNGWLDQEIHLTKAKFALLCGLRLHTRCLLEGAEWLRHIDLGARREQSTNGVSAHIHFSPFWE